MQVVVELEMSNGVAVVEMAATKEAPMWDTTTNMLQTHISKGKLIK